MHYLGMRHKYERRTGVKKTKKSAYVTFLDKVTFVVGVIGPFTVLPQIYTIFSSHSAEGVSLVTWLLMFIVTLPWVFYGAAHKEKKYCSELYLVGDRQHDRGDRRADV